MNRSTTEDSGDRVGGIVAWLSSAVICLFLLSCAEGGGTGPVIEESGTGGGGGGSATGASGDTSSATPVCGDGEINGSEQCDGANLGGATCSSLGHESGPLACTKDCIYDLSMCFSPDGTGGYGS